MKVLVVAPHPDDETLGAGGTILKHLAAGDDVFWLVVTAPDPDDWPAEMVEDSLAQVKAVAAAYPFTNTIELNLPTTRLDQLGNRKIIGEFERVIRDIQPDRVYSVGDTDAHSDHMVVFEQLMLALKPFRQDVKVTEIYAYEALSSTDAGCGWRAPFVPNTYNDISPYMARKLEIMKLFRNQLQSDMLPRSLKSITALGRLRGSTIGVEYAETFRLIRGLM
jgi:LmbE family N-acetylglucosaminyl deacetylase